MTTTPRNLLTLARVGTILRETPANLLRLAQELELQPELQLNEVHYYAARDIDRLADKLLAKRATQKPAALAVAP